MSETPTTPSPADTTDAAGPEGGVAADEAVAPVPPATEGDAAPAVDAPASDVGGVDALGTGEETPAAADLPDAEVPATPADATGADDGQSQTSLAPPAAPVRGLTYAVDIVFCIDVTGA